MQWEMWAYKNIHSIHQFRGISEMKAFSELCGGKNPIVKVKVSINPNGIYYGWINHGTTVPCMIWPTKTQLDKCFDGGMRKALKLKRGKLVRLDIVEIV